MATNYTTLLSEGLITGQFASRPPYVIHETFDLTDLAAVLVDGDSVELFTLPAGILVTGMFEIVTPGTSAEDGTQALTLRAGTNALTAETSTLAAAFVPGQAPFIGSTATKINVLATVAAHAVTLNPVITVSLACINAT